MASTILYEPVAQDVSKARDATPEFVSVFAAGFRERFPGLAAARGFTVSATAEALLRVWITGQRTYCYSNCLHRILLHGELYDAAGKVVWRFDTVVGQATAASGISPEIFDAFALEVLKAMKKDGVIGAESDACPFSRSSRRARCRRAGRDAWVSSPAPCGSIHSRRPCPWWRSPRPAEVVGDLVARLGDDWKVEPLADRAGDVLERHAFLGGGVIALAGRPAFERETIDARRVEPVHTRPAVEAVADVGRLAFLARESHEARNETVVAAAMDRRREAHDRRIARRARPASLLRAPRPVDSLGHGRWEIILDDGPAGSTAGEARSHEKGTLGAFEDRAHRLDRVSIQRRIRGELLEVVD